MKNELPSFPKPKKEILEVLKGKFSEPTEQESFKPGLDGKTVKTRVVKEGSGMIGLETVEDNKEWSGIFEHVLRTGRLASFLAKKLKAKGIKIDPELVLNTVLASHCGRRQWDESEWYPGAVANAADKRAKTDTNISVDLLKKAGISSDIIRNVQAHDPKYLVEISEDNWPAKIALYADYRTSQGVMTLQERIDEFEKNTVPAGRMTEDELNKFKIFFQGVEKEIFTILDDMNADDINNQNPPPANWENYVRRLYINDAEKDIFRKYGEMKEKLEKSEGDERSKVEKQIEELFPEDKWWGKYIKELYEKQSGKPYEPIRDNVKIGIARAIDFFEKREKK